MGCCLRVTHFIVGSTFQAVGKTPRIEVILKSRAEHGLMIFQSPLYLRFRNCKAIEHGKTCLPIPLVRYRLGKPQISLFRCSVFHAPPNLIISIVYFWKNNNFSIYMQFSTGKRQFHNFNTN
jgi:hypothetical protein